MSRSENVELLDVLIGKLMSAGMWGGVLQEQLGEIAAIQAKPQQAMLRVTDICNQAKTCEEHLVTIRKILQEAITCLFYNLDRDCFDKIDRVTITRLCEKLNTVANNFAEEITATLQEFAAAGAPYTMNCSAEQLIDLIVTKDINFHWYATTMTDYISKLEEYLRGIESKEEHRLRPDPM